MTAESVLFMLLGLALGALGAAASLAATRWRAGLARTHGIGLTMLTLPLTLLGPAAAVLLAAWLSPACAWAAILGLVTTRWLYLRRYSAGCCGGDG